MPDMLTALLQEESEVAAEEGLSVAELRRQYPGAVRATESLLQFSQEEREVAAEEGVSVAEIRRRYPEARQAAEAFQKQLVEVEMRVSGVEPLAKSFETLSARAHKALIPNVLARSVNNLNRAIVNEIPVGPRGHRGDTGGWRRAQSRISAHDVAGGGRHTTTVAAALPSNQALGIRAHDDYYPFDVEYGSRFQAAVAPIRRAVHRLEKSQLGEMLDLMGHGLALLAIPVGVGLLLRKAIYGRTTPKGLMPIDWTSTRGRDGVL